MPSSEVLQRASVSAPLLHIYHLACYLDAFIRSSMKDLTAYRQQFSVSIGHSGGVLSAAAMASSDDLDGLLANSRLTGLLALWCAMHLHYVTGSIDPVGSWMCALANTSLKDLPETIESVNKSQPERVDIGVINTERRITVVGHPQAILALQAALPASVTKTPLPNLVLYHHAFYLGASVDVVC